MRLYQVAGAATTRFLYDGVDAIAEYNGTNALQRRFVFDPTSGQPVLWYEGTGTALTNVRYLSQDERGSVISVSDSTAASLGLNTYDEYGKPGSSNLGRYQYTGQKWVPEAGLYDYKARDYLPHLGIFAQTDLVGQNSGPNLYAYVGGDPVNMIDPLGLEDIVVSHPGCSGGVFQNGVCTPSNPGTPPEIGISGPGERRDGGGIEVVHPGCPGGNFVNGVCTPGGALFSPASLRVFPKRLVCTGNAYVMAGNVANIGHEGFPGVTVTRGSAGVIPRQWTGAFTGGPTMRAIGQSTFGWAIAPNGTTEAFSGLTQAIGYAKLGSALSVQNKIMDRAPGQLVLEIVGGKHLGNNVRVIVDMPDLGQQCPVGTM